MTDTVTTLELTGFDEAVTGLVTKYFTRRDRSVISGASDTPAKTSFEPRMVNAGTFDLFMFGNARLGGAGAPAGGAIVLDNHDGGLDYLRGWGLDGRTMTLRRGVVGQAYPSAYTTLLKGTMLAPHFSMTDVTLRIRSRVAEVLNQTLQRDRYKGDNALPDGVEGTEDDIKGLYKPEFWGKGRHIPAVLVNTSKNTYQISRGAITSLDALYVQGAATWTPGTAHASLAALQAATVPASTYDYYLGGNGDGSYLRLGSNPTGAVTVDATAPKSTAADIVDNILQSFSGIPSAEIEGKAALNTANSAPMGYWSGTGQVTRGQAIFELLDGVGGFLTEKRNGNFLMGRLEAPGGSPALTITQTYVDETAGPPEIITNSDIAREVPVYRVGVGYKKVYQVQTGGELAGAATQATRALVGEELRQRLSGRRGPPAGWGRRRATPGRRGRVAAARGRAQQTPFGGRADRPGIVR
jgi:hypothetical protein